MAGWRTNFRRPPILIHKCPPVTSGPEGSGLSCIQGSIGNSGSQGNPGSKKINLAGTGLDGAGLAPDALSTEVWPKGRRNRNAAIGVLMILEHGD
jgi:hypothetical protein